MRALFLLIASLFTPSLPVLAVENSEPLNTCDGRKALYDPDLRTLATKDATFDWNAKTSWTFLDSLQSLPVAFAPTGDECLGPMPIYAVAVHAEPAEDTHAMARQLAAPMAALARSSGTESCARMCRTSQGMIVAQVVTLHAHVVCLAPADTCPQGSEATPETIHSHPPHRVFEANAMDALGWEDESIVGKLTLTGYPDSLSPNDRQQAPVWLVGTGGQLVWLSAPDGNEALRP